MQLLNILHFKENFMNNIGARIRDIRIKSGISQEQLAGYLGISAATLSRYESMQNIPKLSIIVSIAKVFNVSLDYLIIGHK